MPTAAEAGEPAVEAPAVVRVAFWVWVAAGLLGVVGAVLFFALRAEWAQGQVRNRPELAIRDVDDLATGLSWWLVIGSTMFLGFFLLLAHQARRGVRKARTLLLVLGVFAALFEYSVGRVTIYGLLSALLVVVATGLLYAPAARRFFAVSDER